MRPGAVRSTGAVRRLQAVLAGEAQDAAPRGADSGEAVAGPDLSVALAMEGVIRQKPADGQDQLGTRYRANRTRPPRRPLRVRPAVAVERRARQVPNLAYALDTVGALGGGRNDPAHRLDLRRAKGRPPSSRSIFASRRSFDIVRSPTLPLDGRSRRHDPRPAVSSAPPRRRPEMRRTKRSVRPLSRRARATLAPILATQRPNTTPCFRFADIRRRCPGPARLRQRRGRAPTGGQPRPPSDPSSPTSALSPNKQGAVSHRTVDRGIQLNTVRAGNIS